MLNAIISPVIIALGTAYVGNFFQDKNQRHKLDREHRENTLQSARQVYIEVSTTLDSVRYYAMDEAIHVAVRAAKNDTSRKAVDEETWNKYKEIVVAWKMSKNRLLSEVEVYYGKENAELMSEIFELLNTADRQIGATYYTTSNSLVLKEPKSGKDVKWSEFFDPLKGIAEMIRELNIRLNDLLQKEDVANLKAQV